MTLTPRRLLVALGIVFSLWPPSAYSRTWYVRNDGTGDAPTIQAAVDSAHASDTILVGPGTYAYTLPVIIENKDSLTVMSESGPQSTSVNAISLNFANYTSILGFTFENYQFGIVLGWSHHLRIENNIVRNATEAGIYAYVASEVSIANNLVYGCQTGMSIGDASGNIEVRNNTISHCSGWGIFTDASPLALANTIVSFNNVGVEAFNPISVLCSDVHGNGTNYALLGMSDPTGTNGNISVDPLYCGVEPQQSGNYLLQSISPCAPGNHPDGYSCGLIGRNPVGCGSTPVEKSSWSGMKSLYRR